MRKDDRRSDRRLKESPVQRKYLAAAAILIPLLGLGILDSVLTERMVRLRGPSLILATHEERVTFMVKTLLLILVAGRIGLWIGQTKPGVQISFAAVSIFAGLGFIAYGVAPSPSRPNLGISPLVPAGIVVALLGGLVAVKIWRSEARYRRQ